MGKAYQAFIKSKTRLNGNHGFDHTFIPDLLFDFQKDLVQWACKKGRAAIFAECGLGKTFMQLSWAQNVVEHTNGKVLILAPLAVAPQTVREGSKIGVHVVHRRDECHNADRIIVSNYERLNHFKPSDYDGVVLDESSILKSYSGVRRQEITEFMSCTPYRLLCTATAAPNDYVELGTSSEALGVMARKHMLSQFFTHDGSNTSSWRLKGHARTTEFWKWMASWARAIRLPSDMGYDDTEWILPPLNVRQSIVSPRRIAEGFLFEPEAIGLSNQRELLKRTLCERTERTAEIVNKHTRPAVVWCHLNAEADRVAELIPDAVNIQGSDSEERKIDAFTRFADGEQRVIVSKPSIAGFGLNWQHCSDVVYFISHSFEQYYQALRRCWRFGQKKPVNVDVIMTNGCEKILENLERKEHQAEAMFANMVYHMHDVESQVAKDRCETQKEDIPVWL